MGMWGEARLLELIRVDEEEDGLDFKRTYDLQVPKDQLECVKLLVCMANTSGGYAVLGVDKSALVRRLATRSSAVLMNISRPLK
jgi:predicted HTH transcriptional regulator